LRSFDLVFLKSKDRSLRQLLQRDCLKQKISQAKKSPISLKRSIGLQHSGAKVQREVRCAWNLEGVAPGHLNNRRLSGD
ncbi:hypothetical protein, partial [Pseudomonas atacamensis]|uniref:hypothetical protein n=1 Tax=Pseudomonas atacamensis TaxID=2565368 RepID=UPI0028BDA543